MSGPTASVNTTTASDVNANTITTIDTASAAPTTANSDVTTGTATSQGTFATFDTGRHGEFLAFYPEGPHDLVVAKRDSLSAIWTYMDSIIKFTDEKVEEDWKEKGQRPLASALQAFEEAFHEL